MKEKLWVIDREDAGLRLDKFLAHADRLGSRSRTAAALERGKVFVNDAEASVSAGGRRLAAGDRILTWMDRPGTAHRRTSRKPRAGELHIIYEDDTLVVVNKPPGLLTVPLHGDEPSVEDALIRHLRSSGKRRPLIVHRIDRDTSGLVIFAKRPDAQVRLREPFKRHEAERTYLAIVYGLPAPESGTWTDHLAWDQRSLIQRKTTAANPHGKEARSEYRVLEKFEGSSLVEVRLVTGKRNQIRFQAGQRGHTLVGERRYGHAPAQGPPIEFARQALHAYRLGLRHPVNGRQLHFEAPIPEDLSNLIQHLRQKG